MRRGSKLLSSSLTFLIFCAPLFAQKTEPEKKPGVDLTTMDIEDLMNVKVTSVSKIEEKLSRTASAVFVITQADIARSGATNIPDLLRMVPGLDVAQIDANTWAISARGLNDEFSNELLVLLDGRNVYTPTFGGVLWGQLDLPLETIERIEVIRGPGGTIWGANAVNGVINLITKKSGDTHGAMVVTGGGNLDQGFGTAQYGGSLGKGTDFRIYSKYFNQGHSPDITGQSAGDSSHALRGGFRTDSALSTKDALMVQGDIFSGRDGESVVSLPSITSPGLVHILTPAGESGGFLQSVWKRTYSARSDITLSASFSAYESGDVLDALAEGRKTFNIDFQDHIARGERQDFIWGFDYQYSASRSNGALAVSLNPATLGTQLFSSFFQDEIALLPDRLYLTVGTKLEHNYYTGFTIMPSARIAFTLSGHHMVWAAVSRAERTPASVDTAIRSNYGSSPGPGGIPVLTSLLGNPQFKNEGLIAYETGYRTSVSTNLSIDFAAYYNNYGSQQTTEPAAEFLETTPSPVHLVMLSTYENLMHGEAHGFEITSNWKLTDHWTISATYDFGRIHMHLSPASKDTETVPETEGTDPHVHAQLRSHVDLSRTLSWDTSAYFVDRIASQAVAAYTRVDTGLSWRCREGLTVGLVGQNLVRDHHLEFIQSDDVTTLVKRSAYLKVAWNF
jgi:iron complex outermembrane recepter protein